jgi:hypothetical protein
MEVAVQLVRTWWTKESRGGAAAARRNAAPVAFELTDGHRPLTHEITMREEHDFAPEAVTTHDQPGRDVVRLRQATGRLRVMLVSAHRQGVIRRRPPAVRIGPGETLRWTINYRFVGYAETLYRLDTLNVAYGPDIAADVFLAAPTKVVDERAELR